MRFVALWPASPVQFAITSERQPERGDILHFGLHAQGKWFRCASVMKEFDHAYWRDREEDGHDAPV